MKKSTKKMLKTIKKMITTCCIVLCIFVCFIVKPIKSVNAGVIWTNESKTFEVEVKFYKSEKNQ